MCNLDVSDPADQASGQRVISGFWRRLLALFLDLIVLGVLFQVLESGGSWKMLVGGRAFVVGPFWSLGGWSRLVETCVALVYFGVLNSSIAWGQTIGKRVMQVQVIDRSGHSISPGRSFLRSAVLVAPFSLNGLDIPPSAMMFLIFCFTGFILFGFGDAIVYLYIFNRRTRQSLHDLIVGTFVTQTTPRRTYNLHDLIAAVFVSQRPPPGQVVGSIWRPHLIVVGVWLVLVSVLLVVAVWAADVPVDIAFFFFELSCG
jgi:uncharacterized RDD family membrane protein YckC